MGMRPDTAYVMIAGMTDGALIDLGLARPPADLAEAKEAAALFMQTYAGVSPGSMGRLAADLLSGAYDGAGDDMMDDFAAAQEFADGGGEIDDMGDFD